ncbi:MAG: type III pantothenate kinase, partial [Thermoanaerobaculia bacterium]|nr:type III pantothenate kinase [Thermoanaerobaculia bacterium]
MTKLEESKRDLLLLVDVGNTNIELGVFRGEAMLQTFRLSTEIRTADEWAGTLLPLFD